MKTFIFDFDSTIFPGETLDEIIQFKLKDDARSKEKSDKITNICNQGMSGAISMEESLRLRLEIAAPDRKIIENYARTNKERIDPIIINTLIVLQEKGHTVFVVSGGFEEWITPLLAGTIHAENIHANQIKDSSRPMTFDNIIRKDKEEIIKGLIVTRNLSNTEITIIGDGATDFSVFEKGLAQFFWGTFFYTGAEARKNIVRKALEKNQLVFSELRFFVKHVISVAD